MPKLQEGAQGTQREAGRSLGCPVLLNSGESVQASDTSLKTPFSDLTNPFDSPHIIKDGRKFSKTPAIKYFSFPVMQVIIRGELRWKDLGQVLCFNRLYILQQTASKHFVGVGREFLSSKLHWWSVLVGFLTLKIPLSFWVTLWLRESKEFPHIEFWIPVLFIATLAQSERLAISLATGLCCLTSDCFWVKWETWIFFSFLWNG